MLADIHILHESDVYRILDFRCQCTICSLTEKEYNKSFCFSFIRKGFFEYRTFRRRDEVHVGRILLTKPGFEHTTRHIDNQPDLTTVFEFKPWFFERLKEDYSPSANWFLNNNDIHAMMLSCSVEAEYLFNHIMQSINRNSIDRLRTDEEVLRLLDLILLGIGNTTEPPFLSDRLKQNHLLTMERAKEYMFNNFTEDISLNALAEYCYVSPFHFSRIFKAVMNTTPHQYLLSLRLQHARFLLSSSEKPVNDIAYESGFNSLEHFVTAYKQHFRITPSQQRDQLV